MSKFIAMIVLVLSIMMSPFTAWAQDIVLSASPREAIPGSNITVSWSIRGEGGTGDWVGLFAEGTPNNQYLAWGWTNGTSGGAIQLLLPVASGVYEARYMRGSTSLATSGSVYSGIPAPVRGTKAALIATWPDVTQNEDGTPADDLSYYTLYICGKEIDGKDMLGDCSQYRIDKGKTSHTFNYEFGGDAVNIYGVLTATDLTGNESKLSNVVMIALSTSGLVLSPPDRIDHELMIGPGESTFCNGRAEVLPLSMGMRVLCHVEGTGQ